jgi:ABC-type amino acid transport substrate-binding protein
MNKFTFVWIIVTLIIFPGLAHTVDIGLLNPGVVIVAHDNSFPPYGWVENGKPVGFHLDVVSAVISKIGLKVEFQPDAWANVLTSVKLEKADAITTIGITEERKKSYDYSEVWGEFAAAVFVKTGDTNVQKLEDLEGKVVAVQKDSFEVPYLRQHHPMIILSHVDSPPSALKAVLSGKATAAIVDNLVGLYLIKQNFSGQLKKVGEEFSKTPTALAVLKGTKTEFLKEFNKALNAIKSDGTYDRIYAQWFK